MHSLSEQIPAIAEKVREVENDRERLGVFLRELKPTFSLKRKDVLEPFLSRKVARDPLEKRIVAGVDGGLSQKACHGLDMIITRAVAAVFDYEKGGLKGVEYFPSPIVGPAIFIASDPYSDEEFAVSSGLLRATGEVEAACQCFEKYKPNLVLMDGSIVPHSSDVPGKGSKAAPMYDRMVESYKRLYMASAGGMLAGCIEDTRGRRFCEIVSEEMLSKVRSVKVDELRRIMDGARDTNILHHMLEEGERTFVFTYAKNSQEHPVLNSLGQFGRNIYSFYLKTAQFDRPVRIDFYSAAYEAEVICATADKIAGLVLATVCNPSYGFPAPLIEADVRAKISEADAGAIYDQITDSVGAMSGLIRLRREQRPF
ncbi:MAG: DNA double-strand break repair nuclease NurA [Candidatus Aenigmatarchaeota archaeon]